MLHRFVKHPTLRRAAAVMAVITGLSACSAVHQDIRDTFRYVFQSGDDYALTAEEIAAFPYTGVYLRRDGGSQNFVVLGFIDTYIATSDDTSADGEVAIDQFHWVSSDNVTLVTEWNRIIRTVGLADETQQAVIGRVDLRATSNRLADPLRCIVTQPQICNREWTREIEYWQQNRAKSSRVTSQFETIENVAIELPTRTVTTTHIIERGVFHSTNERFVNEFWAEADGHIVKSKQQFMPGEASFEITQVKWVGRDD